MRENVILKVNSLIHDPTEARITYDLVYKCWPSCGERHELGSMCVKNA